jgi:hypothetical protein
MGVFPSVLMGTGPPYKLARRSQKENRDLPEEPWANCPSMPADGGLLFERSSAVVQGSRADTAIRRPWRSFAHPPQIFRPTGRHKAAAFPARKSNALLPPGSGYCVIE